MAISNRSPQRRSFLRLGLASGAGLALCASVAHAQLLTFSVDDFRGEQGFKGWYYGYFNGDSDTPWRLDDFEQLPIFDGSIWRRPVGIGGYWTSLDAEGGHPNGIITSGERTPELNFAVRRWVSDGDYILRLNGRLWDADPTPGHGNGVIGSIMLDGVTIWETAIDNGNSHGVPYTIDVCASPGTIIDYVIDPREQDDFCDSTAFHANIRTVIQTHPINALTCTGGAAEFFVVTLPGEFTYQWRRNGQPIEHDATLARIRIVDVTPELTGEYDCVVTSDCGSMVSHTAVLSICDADFDCDGIIDSRDFFTFVTAYFNETPRADFNRDGFFNTQDYFDFVTLFFTGCDPA